MNRPYQKPGPYQKLEQRVLEYALMGKRLHYVVSRNNRRLFFVVAAEPEEGHTKCKELGFLSMKFTKSKGRMPLLCKYHVSAHEVHDMMELFRSTARGD